MKTIPSGIPSCCYPHAVLQGSQCTDTIATATASIQKLTQTEEGKSQLAKTFNLCTPPKTALDVQNFMSDIASAFMVST